MLLRLCRIGCVVRKDALKKKKTNVEGSKSWYADRYTSVVVQRNILFLFTLIALIGVVFSTFVVRQISLSKSIEPFVIEVEEKTGVTNVIRPFLKEKIAADQAIREYFIVKYMNARETYNFHDFEYQYFTVVRALSDSKVFFRFKNDVNAESRYSPIRYGDKLSRTIQIKFITFLPKSAEARGFVAQVHFVQTDKGGSNETRHRVATVNFDFFDKEMKKQDRYINPLGFQVIDYQVVDETLLKNRR